jgi:hypothetical protein
VSSEAQDFWFNVQFVILFNVSLLVSTVEFMKGTHEFLSTSQIFRSSWKKAFGDMVTLKSYDFWFEMLVDVSAAARVSQTRTMEAFSRIPKSWFKNELKSENQFVHY